MRSTGRCACNDVSYTIIREPLFTHACHCADCQRTTGTAFVVHLVLAKIDLNISGQMRSIVLPTVSGSGNELHFCERCGTYIWCQYRYHSAPVIALRGGTLDDPNIAPPQAHIFTRSMQSWLKLGEDIPMFDEAFNRNDVWPAASLKRYDALMASKRA